MKKRQLILCSLALAMSFSTTCAQVKRDISVDDLFSLIEQNSRALKAQKTGVEVANHAVEEAKSKRLPDVGASLSVSYNGNVLMTDRNLSNPVGISQPHIGNSFSVEARQTVYAGGALNAGISMAELQRQQAQTAVEQTRMGQRFMALGQYLDLFKIDNSVRVYTQNIALTERLIDDIRAKQEQGMALKNDVTRYELQMETLRLGLKKMQDQRSVVNYQLCNTLGLSDTEIMVDTTLTSQTLTDAMESEWQHRAFAQSPVIKQSAIGVQLSEQQLRLAKSEQLPKLAIVAADNFSGPYTYDLPPINNNFNLWYVGIGINYSISSLFKSNKTIRKAKSAVRESIDQQNVSIESVDNQMQQAYTLYKQSFVELHTYQKSVELARQNYDVMNHRYLNQLALVTDMIDASNVRLSAELQEVDARINTVYAYYKLKYIAGEI